MIDKEKLTDAEAHAVALALYVLEEDHGHELGDVPAPIRAEISRLRVEMCEHCAFDRPDAETLR